MKIGKQILFIILCTFVFIGCSNTPDKVLSQEKMAQLLADIHIGESVVDVERTKFYNDSLRKTVKQSILVKHNVTQEELDSSFSWYGRNIEEYIAVYDRVIEILEEDLTQIGSGVSEKVAVTQEGDSTDIWEGIRHYAINPNSASQYITFSIAKNSHTQNGDYYTWRIKLINNSSPINWGLAVDYADGSTEYIYATAANEGWNNLKLISDSTKSISKVYGYIYATPNELQQLYIDSISLTRMRVDHNIYRQRSGQRLFEYGKKKPNTENDTQNNNDNSKTSIDSKKAIDISPNSIESKGASNQRTTNTPNSNSNPTTIPSPNIKTLKLSNN